MYYETLLVIYIPLAQLNKHDDTFFLYELNFGSAHRDIKMPFLLLRTEKRLLHNRGSDFISKAVQIELAVLGLDID
jgi:hypothetical protein